MTTIRVHFDGKVFVPEEPVTLPVGTKGTMRVREVIAEELDQDRIFEILSERYATGETDAAARHNDHQP
jgi:hypothetical protein